MQLEEIEMRRRLAVLILALLMVASVLGGCSGKVDASKYATTAYATFNGEKLYLDELNYYLRTSQYENEEGGYLTSLGVTKWDDEVNYYNIITIIPGDSLRESAVTQVRQYYVLCEEAEKAGVTLTAEEETKVTDAAKKFLAEADEKLLSYLNLSEERLVEIYRRNALAHKMYQTESDKVDLSTIKEEDTIKYDVTYVSITATSVTNMKDELESGATPESVAKEIAERVEKGEKLKIVLKDFSKLSATEISMGDGDNEKTFGKVVPDMKEGEVTYTSNEDKTTYYVVIRENLKNEEATADERKSQEQAKIAENFKELYTKWEAAYEFKPDYDVINGIVISEQIYEKPAETTGADDTTEADESTAESKAE